MHGRTAARAASALGAVTCLALAPATSAGAATGTSITPALLQSNWYYHRLVSDAPVAGAPDVEPSNVPDGDLPVASRDGNGTASKLTTLAFDLPKDAAGGSFSAFDVTMTIDPAATNVVPSDLKLQAAFALRNWPNGKGGDQDTLNAPPFDDKSVATATVNSAGTAFVFHVAPIAQQWADDVNYGLELLPAKGYTTPFQVSFLGGKNVKATATYTAGAPVTTTVPTTPTQATTGGGTSLTTTPTTSLAGAPSLGLAPDTTAVAPALAPPVTAAPPATAPQLAAPAPASAPAAASRPLRHISKLPGTGMVLVGVAVLALLALLSIILGGEPVGVVVRRPSRLSAVLQGRAPRPAAGTPRPVPLA